MKTIVYLWSAFNNVGVRKQWEMWLCDEHQYWAEYLTATDMASSYPCDNSRLDCWRTVGGPVNPDEPDTPFYEAVCHLIRFREENDQQQLGCCESLCLPEDEVLLRKFNKARFLDDLCQLLSITRCKIKKLTEHTYQIGFAQSGDNGMYPVALSLLTTSADVYSEAKNFVVRERKSFYWLLPLRNTFSMMCLKLLNSTQPDVVVVPIDKLIALVDPLNNSALTTKKSTKKGKSKKQIIQIIQPLQDFPSISDLAEQYADELSDVVEDIDDARAIIVGKKVLRGGERGRKERTDDEYKTKSYYLAYKKIDEGDKCKIMSRIQKFRKAAEGFRNESTMKRISYKTIERAVKKWEEKHPKKREEKKSVDRRM